MRRSMLGLAVVAMLALSFAPGSTAQASYTLSGVVLDQDGAPVQGADVSWYQYGDDGCEEVASDDPATEPARCAYDDPHQHGVTTDAAGQFTLSARQGWGDLHVSKDGHASHYEGIDVAGDQSLSIELLRFPEKSAHLSGKTTPGASISIENPVYGIHECSQLEGEGSGTKPGDAVSAGSGTDGDGPEPGNTSDMRIAPYEPHRCAITIQPDGSYAGNVTPGYSIIRFSGGWADGGQQYYSHSVVRDLPADATTRLDVALKARPGPDAVLSGYVVDGASQQAVPDAYVSFSNQDSHGWASATTDKDGSYKVALRSGIVQVHVWADGYLPWEGQVDLLAGERSFDILLTVGEIRYGGCCVAYADGAEGGESAPMAADDGTVKDMQRNAASGEQLDSADSDFEDLGGGLGPYDPARADAEAERESPGLEVLAFIGLLGLLAFVRRR